MQAVVPRFALTAENGPAVASICRRLDDPPLAIELAAARLRVLSPALLLQRLDHRRPGEAGGARDLPERHQTLRGTIAWSCELLSVQERSLFAHLAVFAGGAALDVATAVRAGSGADDPIAHLDQLQTVADQSLIRLSGATLEAALEVIGDAADLHVRGTTGHARTVSALAAGAAARCALPDTDVLALRDMQMSDEEQAELSTLLARQRPA